MTCLDNKFMDLVVCEGAFAFIGGSLAGTSLSTVAISIGAVAAPVLGLIGLAFAAPALITGLIFTPFYVCLTPKGKDHYWTSFAYQTFTFVMVSLAVAILASTTGLFSMPLLIAFGVGTSVAAALLIMATTAAYICGKNSKTAPGSVADLVKHFQSSTEKVD